MSDTTTPQLSQELALPPLTPQQAKEAPHTTSWLKKLMLALRTREKDTATVVSTTTLAGAAASLPPANTPGRLFYATDTHTLYGDDGTSWTAV